MTRNVLLILIILITFNGCYIGASTYKVWERNRNMNIGDSLLNRGYTEKHKKNYNKNHYIYISEHPKNCVYGYIVKKNDKKKIVVGWSIISGIEFCKQRKVTTLIQ